MGRGGSDEKNLIQLQPVSLAAASCASFSLYSKGPKLLCRFIPFAVMLLTKRSLAGNVMLKPDTTPDFELPFKKRSWACQKKVFLGNLQCSLPNYGWRGHSGHRKLPTLMERPEDLSPKDHCPVESGHKLLPYSISEAVGPHTLPHQSCSVVGSHAISGIVV